MLLNIPNFSKYAIDTNTWGVYSFFKSDLMALRDGPKGHYQIGLYNDAGKLVSTSVHRLVYLAIHKEIPEGYDIHHLDGNKHNNNPDNLIAIPHSEHLSLHKKDQKPSQETRKKMSKSQKALKRTISPELRKKMVAGHKGKKHKKSVHLPQRKPICAIGKDGNMIFYDYVNQTAKDGFKPANVSQCCQGTRKSHHGFQFKYV